MTAQIIYDTRNQYETLIDEREARLIHLNRKMKGFEKATLGWLAASALCFGMPIYLSSKAEMSRNLALFNTVCAGLGVLAASQAGSVCGKFQKSDRIIYKEEQHLEFLKERNLEAERGGYEMSLDAKLSELRPQKEQPQQQQVIQAVPDWYEWKEEKFRLESIFKVAGYPVTVTEKHVNGRKLEYTLRPTPGVDRDIDEEDILGAKDKLAKKIYWRAGLENATIFPRAAKLILQVDNPYAPQMLPITARQPQQRELEYVTVGPEHQPAQPNYQQPISFTIQQPQQQQSSINVPNRIQSAQPPEDELFTRYLRAPHNMICGKTGGGKTFLLSRLVIEWVNANPGGTVYILDRNFGKPDRVTGEIFDWNGIDERCIYKDDDAILQVLQVIQKELESDIQAFADYGIERSRCRREGRPFDKPAPQRKQILVVVTEQNELADIFTTGTDIKNSSVLGPIGSILRQGNAYGYKIVLDGQSIAVGQCGITEALRQNLSICMVGENTVTSKEVKQFGSNTNLLINKCSQLRAQGKRACIIQLGEGEPVVSVIPEMGWIRDYQFGSTAANVGEDPDITEFDNDFEEKYGVDPDEVIDNEDEDSEDPWKDGPQPPKPSTSVLTQEELVKHLAEWIKAHGKPTDEDLRNKATELIGTPVSDEMLKGIKWLLGQYGII